VLAVDTNVLVYAADAQSSPMRRNGGVVKKHLE
jgi:hypothetical protein